MFVGVDIGTQSLKAVICDDGLAVIGSASVAYQPVFPKPGWAEQDPGVWEAAIGPAIGGALEQSGITADAIAAVRVSGQLDGCVAVADDGAALAPALIWMDRRAAAETSDVDAQMILERAGVVLDATHMAAKIRWLQRHGPREAVRYHQPVSYLVSRLTGEHRIDHGLASTTMVYALADRAYDPLLLAQFGIDQALLPPVAEAEEVAGGLTAAGASMTGLAIGTPVTVGTGDDFTNALGAGLAEPGRVVCALGTAEVVGALDPRPVIDPGAMVETHAYAGGLYFVENPGWLSGGALTWFVEAHRLVDAAELDALAGEISAGADGVTFLPALSGAMTPEWHAAARGCYYGLAPSHGAGHMARAVLEGCAFAMRDVVERLTELGVPARSLLLVGGGAKSALWAQIRADVTGLSAEIPRHLDTAPIGAAVLAAVAAGGWTSVADAARQVGAIDRVIEPDAARKDAYDDAYGRYRDLFECLRPLYR